MLYKYEFKIHFSNAFYDERNATVNPGQNDTVFGLDNVYVVYLMEKNGGGRSYDISGHMIEYYSKRKIASKLQCNF